MKHFLFGFLFFVSLFLPKTIFASINVSISDLVQKEDYYQVTAIVTGMSSSSATFVQGMFTSLSSTKYFGHTFTKKGEWAPYISSPEKTYVLDNFIELKNDIPQQIFLKPDYESKNYQGSGTYALKFKRFTASGSPSDYSNSIEVNLSYALQPEVPTETPTPSPTTTPTSTSQPTTTLTPTPTQRTPTPSKTNTPTTSSPTSTIPKATTTQTPTTTISDPETASDSSFLQVLSFSTDSATVAATEEIIEKPKKLSDKNLFLIGVSIFSISGVLLYFRLKNV